MSDLGDSTSKNDFDREVGRAYSREFTPAIVGYTVATVAVVMLVDFKTAGWRKYLVAIAPLIPALWGVWAIARHLGRVDEMQRRAQTDAMAVGFGLAMVVAITFGFLAMAGLDANRWAPWVIYSVGMAGWAFTAVRRGAQA